MEEVEELSEEEYKQGYLRQEELRERGITDFRKVNTATKTKGILKKNTQNKTQTNLRPRWAEETHEMFPQFKSQSMSDKQTNREELGLFSLKGNFLV